MRRFKKFLIAVPLSLALLAPQAALAKTDSYIFTDSIANVYTGRAEAVPQIANLNFTDLPPDANDQDAIVRTGALNIIQPTERAFNPGATVTKEEALAYVLRAAGQEINLRDAITRANANLPANSPLRNAWSIGYLNMAMRGNLINATQYAEALSPDPTALDPAINFIRTDPATREEVAFWLTTAFNNQQADIFGALDPINRNSMFSFNDWDQVRQEWEVHVEAMLRNKIMTGRDGDSFDPKGNVTRLEIAQIIKNLDNFMYGLRGLEKKSGTVAALADEQYNETSSGQAWRLAYVRTANGGVDQLQYQLRNNSDSASGPLDAPVLRSGAVGGLQTLREGDRIEYLVETETNEIIYAQVQSGMDVKTVQGTLQMINTGDGTATFTDEAGRTYTFPMIDGLYETIDGEEIIKFDIELRPLASLPLGTAYNITLVNDVITRFEYMGEPTLSPETRGIVIENNPALGYISILDENGMNVTKTYNEGDLRVQKREFYDMRDSIGSIHSMFPDFNYNPQETEIGNIEPGDIVSYRLSPDDAERITSISAATNYTTRYGRISEITDDGGTYQMLLEFENGATAWFTLVDGVPVMRAGRLTQPETIVAGDWARLLVNQAILGPGYMMESIKEVILEGDGHQIGTIIMGRMAGFNAIQNALNLQDAQELTTNGWADYRQLSQVDVGGADVEYFMDGEPVTRSYVNQYLKRADGTVYLALENNYAGEKVRIVSIRTGRDEPLRFDTVLSSGNEGFSIVTNNGAITTDVGTIVRRNGRLVDGSQITPADYAMVSLNGGNQAAVVDITQAPATSGIGITMGIVFSVDQGRSFQIGEYEAGRNQTSGFLNIFSGLGWSPSPQIDRVFTIDNNTMFVGGDNTIDSFITYTANSVAGNVYTVVYDGARAVRVIQMPEDPYPNSFFRGTIYEVNGGAVSIRNTQVYDSETGRWSAFRPGDTTATVNTQEESVIIDRNQLISANGLQVGQQILVCTDVQLTNGAPAAVGYIIQVER